MTAYKKKERRIVADTIRKIHAPNHEAAVLLVSGSPLENFEYTFTPPIKPTTAPMAYINLVAGSKYEVTILVASVIPAEPLPCANAPRAANIRAAERNNLFFVIMILEMCRESWMGFHGGLILFTLDFSGSPLR
ncbi:MAG: hypothetical protein BGO84_03060 [Dysgonomonas sp. 37-18]|nr:MAG: hypothetical protein BGO84_03060 [Dysgonomonas sp. 37-18]